MIYVTGDIHADPRRFDTSNFPEQKEMTKNDFVIVCGDFGLCWEKEESDKEEYWLNWLEAKPFTMCFVDGNHENFSRLNSLPIEDWNGGKVHKLRPHVIHVKLFIIIVRNWQHDYSSCCQFVISSVSFPYNKNSC